MSVRVTLESVSVALGGRRVLDAVDLDVVPGELVTLLGPSGSGKTTTLNVLAGFVRQSAGHVRLDGELADSVPAERRDVGFVFQSYALFPHMTVAGNIGFPLRARRVAAGERRRRIADTLDLVRLGGFDDRPARSLSGGQQQRVALARALVFRPRVLLLDEPLAALDQGLRQTMQHELKRIQSEVGVTTVAVTHDQTEAMTMSDRVAVVREGRIDQIGTPEELYRRPRTTFVATFLGESNLVPVTSGELAGFGVRLPRRATGRALLRPEDLTVGPPGAGLGSPPSAAAPAAPAAARCPAVVETVEFQGWRYRLSARARGTGQRLVVSLPPHHPVAPLSAGSEVEVGCPRPESVHVLADGA